MKVKWGTWDRLLKGLTAIIWKLTCIPVDATCERGEFCSEASRRNKTFDSDRPSHGRRLHSLTRLWVICHFRSQGKSILSSNSRLLPPAMIPFVCAAVALLLTAPFGARSSAAKDQPQITC